MKRTWNWGNRSKLTGRGDDGHDGGNDRWELRGSGNHAGGRRGLDLAVADLRDGLDAGLGDGGDNAGEQGYRGSGETHLDLVCVVGCRGLCEGGVVVIKAADAIDRYVDLIANGISFR